MVPNLVEGGADIIGDLGLIGDIGRHGERLCRGGQILDRGLQVLRLAVDGDDARPALGQKPHGRGADDAGSPGHDGNLAIQANSIGHGVGFPWLVRLFRIRGGGIWRTNLHGVNYFMRGAGWPVAGEAATRPFPAVFGVLTRVHASG